MTIFINYVSLLEARLSLICIRQKLMGMVTTWKKTDPPTIKYWSTAKILFSAIYAFVTKIVARFNFVFGEYHDGIFLH